MEMFQLDVRRPTYRFGNDCGAGSVDATLAFA
jgi:hypothetical protein